MKFAHSLPAVRRRSRERLSAMRRAVWVLLLLIALNPLPAALASTRAQTISSAQERALALLPTLTPEERVGQLFLVSFTGTDAGPASQIYDLITNYHVGGVVLAAQNDNFAAAPQTLAQSMQLNRQLQNNEWGASQRTQINPTNNQEFTPAYIPIFIGISQEGDGYPYDQILSGMTPLPSQMAIGATWQPDLARRVGSVVGDELGALGFNLLLGPSVDVLETPHPAAATDLGVRSFGGDPYWVGVMARSYITGIHEGSEGRIAVIAKHFPGHGSSDRLPEEEIATVRKSLDQLDLIELAPFYAITGNAPNAESTVDGLLASHIRYQGLQGNIRATTRPVSLDPQAFSQLMALPALAAWKENGGITISDNLSSRPFRQFLDPTGLNFSARIIARDAFQAGNDVLYLGNEFIASGDPDSYTTIVRTLAFFSQKYREDASFAQLVDASVLRILTKKFELYNDVFTLTEAVPPLSGIGGIGKSGQATFDVALSSATLINPSLSELADILPEAPELNERVLFFTDARSSQQCSSCPVQEHFTVSGFESTVMRLYGPSAGGQVLQRNLESYSFRDLLAFLDNDESVDLEQIDSDLQAATWIVFAMLDVSERNPDSQALSRFLAERPDLFRQKRLVVFAFNTPYELDQTEVSKLTAYFGMYSKAPQFLDVAARLLFREIQAPPGDLPVPVAGVGYDLISATAPDPGQVIPLHLDLPAPTAEASTPAPLPTEVSEFELGDLVPVRTGVIVDQNGHPVPDDTLVNFIFDSNGSLQYQVERTTAGVARTTYLIQTPGSLTIRVESEPALQSDSLTYEIPTPPGFAPAPTATPQPTSTPPLAPTVTPTAIPAEPAAPEEPSSPGIGEWLMALLVTGAISAAVYWMTALTRVVRWGIRSGFLTLIGGMLAYLYLAAGLPGSDLLIQDAGMWGVLLASTAGASAGWGAALGWQRLSRNQKGNG